MASMKILVSGGGIAGNAVAFWLSKLGHDVTVVERFSSLRTTGLQIDLRGHGIEVLKRMGLDEAFRAKAAPEQGIQVVDKSGRRRGYFPANTSGKGNQNFTSEYEIMRGDLCRIMYDVTKDRVEYVFGTSIESFEETEGGVEVKFADGKTGRYDLLIGADGQGSRTRRMMLGPGAADAFVPIGDGEYIAYFTIPQPMREGEGYMATFYLATGIRWVLTRRSNSDEIQVYLACRLDTGRLRTACQEGIEEEKAALAEVFKGAGWKLDELVESLKDTDNFYGEHLGLVKLDSWSRGRVTLLGDAGFCPSVHTGMGTTGAMVGAYILAGEIGRHCGGDASKGGGSRDGIAAALKAYEQKFQPFMNYIQKGVEEKSSLDSFMSTSFGIAVINCLVGIASLFKVNIGKWSLKETLKGWELPEYEEMARD
ncbi:hypothetical protein VC83_08486 [Pseudogymnoascus destructans]|uniref:FAD-binding domain-containing protein n=2 Tax=Pseudogymnoascus destructans TaxID=655981 RepID=L8G2T7_PSED2|nr:uncharacterized protein VC83_08486 [Pseudogymnoascus destructans]ELR06988.1 hypothetical protein GMDG_08222 [Pseudogymnoascus destructans 20631-21]OAF55119.1 hypothetical protein VC83_08486 [Pseudogymnoascus destructans]